MMRCSILLAAAAAAMETSVLEDMRRSLHRWPRARSREDAQKYVRDILAAPSSSKLGQMLVLNGRVYYNAPQHDAGELEKHKQMAVRWVREHNVRNAAYLHHAGADAGCIKNDRGHLPTTIVAKRRGHCGILVPNPYFASHSPAKDEALARASSRHPWASREDKAFWRGSMRLHSGCHYNAGNWARFLGLALTLKRPDLFDVRTARRSPAPPEWHNATWLRSQKACVDAEALIGDLDAVAARLDETVEPGRFYDELDFCERKLFVHFPGGESGSYARDANCSATNQFPRLDHWLIGAQANHLFGAGGALLWWNQTAIEHYHAGLEEGRTHLTVDFGTAPEAVEAVLSDAVFAKRLREGAAEVQKKLLCYGCLGRYYAATLGTIRKHFQTNLALDSREALRATLRGVDCTGLRLVGYKNKALPPATSLPEPGEDPVCLALVDRVYPPRRRLRGNLGRSRRSIAIILAVVGAFGLVVLLIGCGVYAGCICVHNRAHSVDNRPPMVRAEPNPNNVAVGALMTVQVPEGLGPGSVFPVDVPGRGACRVTVPPGVFAGQTFTLLHPDYVGTSN